jgi:indole-3-glycerol phosphate synthase
LSGLEVDLDTFSRLSDKVPGDVTLIAESGIKTEKDARKMMSEGADGMLIGTAIMDGKVEENIKKFTEAD